MLNLVLASSAAGFTQASGGGFVVATDYGNVLGVSIKDSAKNGERG